MIDFVWLIVCCTAYETYVIPPSNEPPNVRQLSRAAYDSENNAIMLFSGLGDSNIYYDDFWKFDISTKMWDNQKPANIIGPEPRINHGMFYDSSTKYTYLFGGEGKQGYLNDLWSFDQQQRKWIEQQATGDIPPPISRFAFTTYKDANSKLHYAVCNGKGLFNWVTDVYR